MSEQETQRHQRQRRQLLEAFLKKALEAYISANEGFFEVTDEGLPEDFLDFARDMT